MDEAELTKALKDKSLESLLEIDKLNLMYLKQQTGKSIEEITRILKEKEIKLEDINGSNITDVLDKLRGRTQMERLLIKVSKTSMLKGLIIINKK
jgi:hypothetical protein